MAEPFADVPGNVRVLIQKIGFLEEEQLTDEMNEVYEPVRHGKCITCHNDLGEHTILLIATQGIMAAYCCGPCMQDYAVLGWLQEQHQDVVDAIEFRGNQEQADGTGQ
jgi:hypothetical protein